MSWMVPGIAIAIVLLLVWLRVRRRWIDPWQELEELVTALVERKAPRKILMTGNARANVLGLALEKFAHTQDELEVTATQGRPFFLATSPKSSGMCAESLRVMHFGLSVRFAL